MKFSDLSVGEQFKLHREGTLLTKTGGKTFAGEEGIDQQIAAGTEVLTLAAGPAPQAPSPYGAGNKVSFRGGYVRLEGSFTTEQLDAVRAQMSERPWKHQ